MLDGERQQERPDYTGDLDRGDLAHHHYPLESDLPVYVG